jgi:hypothetical protein
MLNTWALMRFLKLDRKHSLAVNVAPAYKVKKRRHTGASPGGKS